PYFQCNKIFPLENRPKILGKIWFFMIFPALVFLGLKNNDCCGCCGNESCGRRFAMLSSILFAAVGALGAGYSVVVSCVAINKGPLSEINNPTLYLIFRDYLRNHTLWSECKEPTNVVSWHLGLFCVLLVMGLIQIALCAVQVINGLLGALCGDCCGCCGGVSVQEAEFTSNTAKKKKKHYQGFLV
uniref:Transmembrane 4 L six family member 4 n=1 Tax=Xiphophorus couchianus TaxID=32473 RepID=A0A3B5LJ12_9TELE